ACARFLVFGVRGVANENSRSAGSVAWAGDVEGAVEGDAGDLRCGEAFRNFESLHLDAIDAQIEHRLHGRSARDCGAECGATATASVWNSNFRLGGLAQESHADGA